MSPGGPGYLQTITTITMTSEAEFGTLGKHFGLRAGAQLRTALLSSWVYSQDG